jgi:hypothetical protein
MAFNLTQDRSCPLLNSHTQTSNNHPQDVRIRQEIDQAAALRLRQYQQRNREEAERRRAMQAAADRAREEKAERDVQRAQAKQRPAAGPAAGPAGPAPATTSAAPPPALRYQVHACMSATSAGIERMIAGCDKEVQEVQEQKRQLESTVTELAERLRALSVRSLRLKEDLVTKRQEEALKHAHP